MKISKILKRVFSVVFILIFFLCIYITVKYPIKYKDDIEIYSKKYNVSPYIVASVINVESSFNENALSNKGALGLMQLMPSTAQWLCEMLGKNYNQNDLFEAKINIELGTYYISYLLCKFDDFTVALCAYNAGEGTVKSWLLNEEYSKDGKTLSKIPFQETKNYVKKVKRNLGFYEYRFKNFILLNKKYI